MSEERMTQEQFTVKQDEMLADIPQEFRGALSYCAWEEGHAYGYENVISCLSDLVDGLEEPFKKYIENIDGIMRALIVKHGVKGVVDGLCRAVCDIAEKHVLQKNGRHRNSIDYRKWEKAYIALGNLSDIVDLPPYPPYH